MEYTASCVKFAIIVILLSAHVDIVLNHFVDLHTQLLVHLFPHHPRVHKQRHHESHPHQQQDYYDGLPDAGLFVLAHCVVILFDEGYALFWRL